jgi:hypothetical protein
MGQVKMPGVLTYSRRQAFFRIFARTMSDSDAGLFVKIFPLGGFQRCHVKNLPFNGIT